MPAQNLPSHANIPTVTDAGKDGDKAAITPRGPCRKRSRTFAGGNADSVSSPASSTASTNTDSEDAGAAAAKDAVQNPLVTTISVPFQNNTFFNVGSYRRTENGLLLEPVIPCKLSENWNLITRTIVPVIYQPLVSPSQGSDFGLGNLNPQFFLSPARSGQII